ncbi:MAG: DUF3999 domain-containing protein [Cystobacterineae bacterium]|nr:DUF3999 domain-containing protein [Cystobacterineae bacterium]
MKKTGAKGFSFLMLLCAVHAHAGTREDYAQQWTLHLPHAEGGIYQVMLNPEVYQKLQSPGLLDLEVFNAKGQPLPAALLKPAFEVETSSKTVSLPWFALPPSAAKESQAQEGEELAMWITRNTDGSVRLLKAQSPSAGDVVLPSSWLVDVGSTRETLQVLIVDWAEDAEPFEQHVDVEGSDDLRQWQLLIAKAPLLHLPNAPNVSKEGQALRHNRIELNSNHRYLRLKLTATHRGLPLTGVRAEFVLQVTAPQNWQWVDLPGKRIKEQGQSYFAFELGGRFPIERVDVLAGNNETQKWVLQSADVAEGVWRTRTAAWLAYVVHMGGTEIRSSAQPLNGVYRDRYWRLVPDTPVPDTPVPDTPVPDNFAVPTLRLFYRPETLAFMLQGEAPYALAAGSTKAVRLSSALLQTLEALRQQKGESWQPAMAELRHVETLAGDDALKPVPIPREDLEPAYDWKTWLLWGILAAGAVLVLVFAFSLLRANRGNGTPPT